MGLVQRLHSRKVCVRLKRSHSHINIIGTMDCLTGIRWCFFLTLLFFSDVAVHSNFPTPFHIHFRRTACSDENLAIYFKRRQILPFRRSFK